ncbi:hypothetical protein EMPS_03850 [Entomortierella parvispora]|uniref:WD40 repeat-like protein n=1 Tax=Entomortierella parvispora TaxID=205924 RepID=A0A9P3LV90_9FUNG|nr:hypothetical protein EMPS_03850 [Entomortierella parvispora]
MVTLPGIVSHPNQVHVQDSISASSSTQLSDRENINSNQDPFCSTRASVPIPPASPLEITVQSTSVNFPQTMSLPVVGLTGSSFKVPTVTAITSSLPGTSCLSTELSEMNFADADTLRTQEVDCLAAEKTPPPTAVPRDADSIEDTPQLFLCGLLLRNEDSNPRAFLMPLPTPAFSKQDINEEEWLQYMEHNPLEKNHVYNLITRMVTKFVADPTWEQDSIREVVLIAPLLDKNHHRQLVRIFLQEFQHSSPLDISVLHGLAQLARDGPLGCLAPNDLTSILISLRERLERAASGKDTSETIHLIRATTVLLTTLSTALSKDQTRLEHEPLFGILSTLRKHRDPLVKFPSRYARQLLISISDQGASRKQWFLDVQKTKEFVQNRLFSDLNDLIHEGPSTGNANFQWHVCQLLGEVSVDHTWSEDIRHQTVMLLLEYAKDKGTVKCGQDIKRWAFTIVRRISELSTPSTPAGSCHLQVTNNEAISTKKQGLDFGSVKGSLEPFDFAHPLTSSLPLPASSPLLHKVITDPDVEVAIDRLLRHRTREYDTRAVYIQLLSKRSIQSSEDDLVELQERAKMFLGSKSEVLLVLGDSGAGKTTFGMHLENELWTEYKPGGRIPLFIDLKTIDKQDRDMIGQHLDDLGFFTVQQIEDMRKSRQFVLICDGYDELHKWTNLHTISQFNKPRQWQVQMIISCRTQYLGPNYRHYFEPESRSLSNPDFSHQSELFEEAVIVPFRSDQIEEYVELFTQAPKTYEYPSNYIEWNTEQYMDRIKSITHLMELAKNPFMLKMILDVLPRIARTTTKMTRVELYDQFVELHFESEHQRLLKQQSSGRMDNGTISVFTSLKDNELFDLGLHFSKQLSHHIFKDLKGVNSVTYSIAVDAGSWKERFFGADNRTKLLRQTAQLVSRENNQDPRRLIRHDVRPSRKRNSYEFSHRSILEYFYSCLIFDPRGNSPPLDLATCLHSTDSPLPVINHPIGQTNIVSEQSIIHFLAERADQSGAFHDQLQDIVELSKAEKATATAASNAITILVQSGQRFSGADLRGIQVPGADMSCGNFDSAQLQGADLSNTTLRNVWMRQADLSNSRMEGVQFGEYPYIDAGEEVRACTFSPDGRFLAAGLHSGKVDIYDASTLKRVHESVETIRDLETGDLDSTLDDLYLRSVSCLAYSPNGYQMAVGSDSKSVHVLDTQTGAFIAALSDHNDRVSGLAYSPSGLQIASGGEDQSLRVWDIQTRTLVLNLRGHTRKINAVAYSPSGHQIASGSWDKTVRLWDAQTGVRSHMLIGHEGSVACVVYSPNGLQIASGSEDKTIRLWDAETGALSFVLSGHSRIVCSLAYSPRGHLIASCSTDETARMWDVQNGAHISTFGGHTGGIDSISYSPSGHHIATASWDTTIRLWEAEPKGLSKTSSGHGDGVNSVVYSTSGNSIVTSSWDETVRVWDAQTGALHCTLGGHKGGATSAAFSPCGRHIASSSYDKIVRLWNAQAGTLDSSLLGHTENVASVMYSPTGNQIASGSWDMTVRLWDARTGSLQHSLSGHTGAVSFVKYSPCGHQVASCSLDNTVRLWDVQTGACILTLTSHTKGVTSVAYSSSGHQIASSSKDKTVKLWDTQSGALLFTLSGHTDAVRSVAYSPNGHQVLSGGMDETVRLWDLDSRQCILLLGDFKDGVNSVAWDPIVDGTYFAVGAYNRVVAKWRLVKAEGEIQAFLHWRSIADTLVLSKTRMQGVQGLSGMDIRLLQQQGAEGEPATV